MKRDDITLPCFLTALATAFLVSIIWAVSLANVNYNSRGLKLLLSGNAVLERSGDCSYIKDNSNIYASRCEVK